MTNYEKYITIINKYGEDILISPNMISSKEYIQHGNISVYDHSKKVACLCVAIANHLPIKVNMSSLVRGALLHDYFLYDWHIKDKSHRWHGFTHAKKSLKNAQRDFNINDLESDMIKSHMFPLNLHLPKYKESYILCLADKISTINEVFTFHIKNRKR